MRHHPKYPLATRILLIGLLIILTFQLVWLGKSMAYGSPGTTDFIAFWSAGQLLRNGENPHDIGRLLSVEASHGWSKTFPLVVVNPPWSLMWLYPLFLFEFLPASLIWLGVNLALLLVAGSMLWLVFSSDQARRRLPIAWFASVAFAPALFVLRMGQISSLSLLGIAGFLLFIRSEQDFIAGAFLALTTAKPHTVYLVWIFALYWMLVERRWRVLAGCFSVLALSSAAITAQRSNWIIDYRTALNNLPLDWATPTIGGALRSLTGIHAAEIQFLAPALTGLLAIGYLVRAKPAIDWQRTMSPILLLSVATAAYGWTYDQIVLLVVVVQLVVWLVDGQRFNPANRYVVAGGMILYSGALIALNLLRVNEMLFLWAPWVLGAVYAYAWSQRNPTLVSALVRPAVLFADRGR